MTTPEQIAEALGEEASRTSGKYSERMGQAAAIVRAFGVLETMVQECGEVRLLNFLSDFSDHQIILERHGHNTIGATNLLTAIQESEKTVPENNG